MQDIDLSSITDFEPIGSNTGAFTGTFDGNYKKISNLTINRETESYVGLFGETSATAIIKDLTMENATVVGNENTGIIVGMNKAIISNVSVIGTSSVEEKGLYVGGIAGQNSEASITDSNSNASVTVTLGKGGGLVGLNTTNASITNCQTTATVTGAGTVDEIGGLVGYNDNSSTIAYSSSSGTDQELNL